MKIKLTAIILAFVLVFGCLAGCGSAATAGAASPSPSASADASVAVSATPAATEDPNAPRYAAAYAAHSPDDVVMTVNGEDVTWGEYYYWIYTVAKQIETNYGDVDWTGSLDDTHTYQSYAQYCAEQMLTQYWVIEQKAKELGVTVSTDGQASIDSIYQDDIKNYGGGDEEAFKTYLADNYIPFELYQKMNQISQEYKTIFENNFGAEGASLSDEDAISYATDAGYIHAKHILFKTVDADGNALDADTIAQKKAKAEDALTQLKACKTNDELTAKFDELMKADTEDEGLASFPDGYYFAPGEMVQEFEDAATALDEYGLSDIVESSYGYHIILRLPLSADGVVDSNGSTLRYAAATALFNNMTSEWFSAATLEYKDAYQNMDFNALFQHVASTEAPADSAAPTAAG